MKRILFLLPFVFLLNTIQAQTGLNDTSDVDLNLNEYKEYRTKLAGIKWASIGVGTLSSIFAYREVEKYGRTDALTSLYGIAGLSFTVSVVIEIKLDYSHKRLKYK